MYHYTFGGLRDVWLVNGYRLARTPDGQEAVAFADGEGLEMAICSALVDKASKLTGAEFRFVRQSGLALSQVALGRLLGADAQAVARWEKTSRVPRWADKMLRLVFRAHADGNEPIRRAIERLDTVERLVHQKIVLREQAGRWQPKVKEMSTSHAETG